MPISPDTIAAIQQAGQALNAAQAALADTSLKQATRVSDAMAADPYALTNDSHFQDWKSIARMAKAVQEMEAQLKNIYFTASDIAYQTPSLPTPATRSSLRIESTKPAGGDIDDATPVEEATGAAAASGKPSRKAKARRAKSSAVAKPKRSASGPLKGNNARLLEYLQSVLKQSESIHVTQASMAKGASIPLGSIGYSLGVLMTKGLLIEGERGNYSLA